MLIRPPTTERSMGGVCGGGSYQITRGAASGTHNGQKKQTTLQDARKGNINTYRRVK